MTTANSVLDQRLSETIGDWLETDVTTVLTSSTSILSTNLNAYDDGRDDRFNNWYAYITEYNNAGQDRKIYDYNTASGECLIRGAKLISDGTDLATVRISKYSWTAKQSAINDAIRQLGKVVFDEVDDRTLVTGNILPNSSFEDWVISSTPSFYVSSSGDFSQTTTAGYYRGARGTTSLKFTTSAANGEFYITSNDYPRLLDIMNKTVSVYAQALPEVSGDPVLVISTTSNDGTTTQGISSSTNCAAGVYTLVKLEDQLLNDDLSEVKIKFRGKTNAKYIYWDNARLIGRNNQEFLLPEKLQDGTIEQVYMQTDGYSDETADDLMPRDWAQVWGATYFDDGTYKFIRLPSLYPNN
ncbi:MAG: hypothetical protein KJ556_22055, partial [Gammaproteobacteria bacterium]|nr:hypothetical protein [Gammaproteobacteria bacterium]